ncbi:MAG: glycosyltransferase family 2 protein [Hydrogenophaga sp.]|uniref:glycosyltransferase family 2 protein n=1 Tax=Hydrogenophaga sp. TaxID=1904254 RepID=UPI0025C1E0B0|nr:glycosyltransferase family 2 protein [Hydrogenophaga sp.]MBT9550052.1 glycosyltransferase family 2 protein [Hydrogenophaga sp.]
MNTRSAPCFSVIVATYNWSSALALALSSVLDQTEPDFELLVIGDACTDDSEAVVTALNDPRVRWINLEHNCGSQWGPNNVGLSLARGRHVAYLGHDDLWAPRHLEAARQCFDATHAEVLAAGCLLYGPPTSGLRALTGFFPHDRFTPRHFFPPSSLIHTRQAAHRAGGWVGPDVSRTAVDQEFLLRLQESGARFASTGEISVFKFNAAWRRNAYRRRDVAEQRACLAALRENSPAYLMRELTTALRAASEDRLLRIETPLNAERGATVGAGRNQAFKGSHRPMAIGPPVVPDKALRFDCEDEFAGFEWHGLETDAGGTRFRWIGPCHQASRALPVGLDRPVNITIRVVNEIQDGLLNASSLSVNHHPVGSAWIQPCDHGFEWHAHVDPTHWSEADRAELLVTITVPSTHRPLDLGINDDRRWLGLAIGWMEVAPA